MSKEKSIAIMQPYFLPYIGYWQLMNSVDQFVIYDNIQYTKKGWINRNRYLVNGKAVTFTLPLKKDSDYLDVRDRRLSDSFGSESRKLVRKVESAYKKAPNFDAGFELFERCLTYRESNLFRYILYSIEVIRDYLGIKTELLISSEIDIDHGLRAADKVMKICDALGANEYINPIGGIELYDKNDFRENGIELKFLEPTIRPYQQYSCDFIPGLSIIDVIMFNDSESINNHLKSDTGQ
jgi:hypothetical protein